MFFRLRTPPPLLDPIFVQGSHKASEGIFIQPLISFLHNIILHLPTTSLMLNCLSLVISVHANAWHIPISAGKGGSVLKREIPLHTQTELWGTMTNCMNWYMNWWTEFRSGLEIKHGIIGRFVDQSVCCTGPLLTVTYSQGTLSYASQNKQYLNICLYVSIMTQRSIFLLLISI